MKGNREREGKGKRGDRRTHLSNEEEEVSVVGVEMS